MPPRGVINSHGSSSLLRCAASGGASAGGTWPAANRALYAPFIVEVAVTAYQMAFEVVTQSGNCDVGIYDELGNRLVSSGSTAVAVAGLQAIDITDTLLTPGVYYMAMNVDNTTASVMRSSSTPALLLRVLGAQQQAVGAVTLPDPAVFANPASAYFPSLSIALTATI